MDALSREPAGGPRILIVAWLSLSKRSGRGLRAIGKWRAAILALGEGQPFFGRSAAFSDARLERAIIRSGVAPKWIEAKAVEPPQPE